MASRTLKEVYREVETARGNLLGSVAFTPFLPFLDRADEQLSQALGNIRKAIKMEEENDS